MPDIEGLRALTRSLAMLDAVVCPEWEYRYYSFDSNWGEDEEMASMRNGSGDHYFALFSPSGAILKGFAHESAGSRYANEEQSVGPGSLDDVPQVFSAFLQEPTLEMEATTFCIWRTYNDLAWQRSHSQVTDESDSDGSEDLLSILDGKPGTYKAWAEDYYERPIDLKAVEHIYQYHPLTREVVAALNPDLSFEDLAADIEQIGYPVAYSFNQPRR